MLKRNLPVLLLSIGHGTVDFYLSILQAVAPSLAVFLGLPLGQVVALVGIGSLVSNSAQPVIGYIMGNRNTAWVIWAGVALSLLPTFMGWSSGIVTLAILVFVGAVGTGIYHPEGVLAAHDASGDDAHFGIPLFMAGGSLMSAVAAPVAIYWVEYMGYPSMVILGIPGLLLALVLYLQYHNRRRKHPSVFIRPRSRRITKMEKGRMSFWPLWTVSVCFGIATALVFAILSSHYELSFGPTARAWAGWVLMVLGAGGAAASFLWGSLSKKYGYYRVVLLTQIVSVPLFVWLAYAGSPFSGFLAAIPLSIVAPGAVYPVSITYSKTASGVTQGLRTALAVGGTWGVAAIVVTMAGWLIERNTDSHKLLLISAAFSVVAVVLAAWQVATGAAGTRGEGSAPKEA